jgi:hypothetical protein
VDDCAIVGGFLIPCSVSHKTWKKAFIIFTGNQKVKV